MANLENLVLEMVAELDFDLDLKLAPTLFYHTERFLGKLLHRVLETLMQ